MECVHLIMLCRFYFLKYAFKPLYHCLCLRLWVCLIDAWRCQKRLFMCFCGWLRNLSFFKREFFGFYYYFLNINNLNIWCTLKACCINKIKSSWFEHFFVFVTNLLLAPFFPRQYRVSPKILFLCNRHFEKRCEFDGF